MHRVQQYRQMAAIAPRRRKGHCGHWLRRRCSSAASQRPALVVGAAQLVATRDLATNVDGIIESIVAAGRMSVDLLAFAEAATTGEF